MLQNRRQFIRKIASGTAAAIAVPAFFSCRQPEDIQLTILHTNDVHSHIDPFPADHYEFPNQGGFARRSTLIQRIRREQKHVLLLDAGDIFQGTPYFNFYKGRLELDLMSKMGYDAATLGNHEFDNGIDELSKQVRHAKFPFLCANYDFSNTALNGSTKPFHLLNKGGLKIGIFGLGIELNGLVNPASYKETLYNDPIQVAQETCQHLKEVEQCDYIICLSHLGYTYKTDKVSDQVIAKKTKHLDLIIGGHTHTYLPEPVLVTNDHEQPVLINQVGWGGAYLGRIDVVFKAVSNQQKAYFNTVYHV